MVWAKNTALGSDKKNGIISIRLISSYSASFYILYQPLSGNLNVKEAVTLEC